MKKATKQQKPQLTGVMAVIEEKTKVYAEAHADLAGTMSGLLDEINQVKAKYRRRILDQVTRLGVVRGVLREELVCHPELFEKPRTVTFHGIKVGYRKGEGRVEYSNATRTIELIEKHLADQVDLLVITARMPNKDAIAQLPADDVKRIGCSIVGTGDTVVIKSTEGDIEKAIEALLKDDESKGEKKS